MKIEVLVATMFNDNIEELVDRMNIKTDCVIVNQCNKKESIKKITYKNKNITIIDSNERGISNSRNKAIENVAKDTDIIIIADDDIRFSDDYHIIIPEKYKKNKCDVIIFNVKRLNGRLNKKMPKKIGRISLFRACSVSLTFKYQKIKNMKFDVDFGTGSGKYILGEENIFVNECLNNKYKILTDNYVMCEIQNIRESTWNNGIDKDYLISKGASFKRMHKYIYFIFIADFAIRKNKESKLNIFQSFKYLFKGANEYRK